MPLNFVPTRHDNEDSNNVKCILRALASSLQMASAGCAKRKQFSPWSYPHAAAAGAAAAATSAAASEVCTYYVVIGGRFAPPHKYMIKYIILQQKQQQK